MLESLLTNASEAYAYAYFGSVLVVALVEWAVPRRTPADMLGLRWSNNFAISLLNTLIIRAAFPVATIAWATLCAQYGWGLLNAVNWPSSIDVLVTIVALDLVVYTQHYLLHRIPMLWRLHRTHHSDADYDFTTAVRFHPLEAMFTARCNWEPSTHWARPRRRCSSGRSCPCSPHSPNTRTCGFREQSIGRYERCS